MWKLRWTIKCEREKWKNMRDMKLNKGIWSYGDGHAGKLHGVWYLIKFLKVLLGSKWKYVVKLMNQNVNK